jgi:hypothetical protein
MEITCGRDRGASQTSPQNYCLVGSWDDQLGVLKYGPPARFRHENVRVCIGKDDA